LIVEILFWSAAAMRTGPLTEIEVSVEANAGFIGVKRSGRN
jgi:hypothetical protein